MTNQSYRHRPTYRRRHRRSKPDRVGRSGRSIDSAATSGVVQESPPPSWRTHVPWRCVVVVVTSPAERTVEDTSCTKHHQTTRLTFSIDHTQQHLRPCTREVCQSSLTLWWACNYSATSNNMKLEHWPLMGGLSHLAQRGGDWAGPQPA